MSAGQRDAQEVFPPLGARAVPPRHTAVWIRTGGAWRAAEIVTWLMSPGQTVAVLRRPASPSDPHPMSVAYSWGDGSIRYRDSDLPPDRWRWSVELEEVLPLMRRPWGTRPRIGPVPPCPGCGAPVALARPAEPPAPDRSISGVIVLPCGQHLRIDQP